MKSATLADRKDVQLEHEAYRRVAELWAKTMMERDQARADGDLAAFDKLSEKLAVIQQYRDQLQRDLASSLCWDEPAPGRSFDRVEDVLAPTLKEIDLKIEALQQVKRAILGEEG